jgi:hypothetical protein
MLSAAYRAHNCETGQWMNVDGNLMRVKIFKNGNAHFEIHPDVAWKLNEVLAHSMPAIPAPCQGANNKGAERVWLHPENGFDENANADPRPPTQ